MCLAMINKVYLENLQNRISGLETEMSAPGVAANPQKMQALMHDYSHQKKVAAAAEIFLKLQDAAAESRAMLSDASTDAELREMAQAELADADASTVSLVGGVEPGDGAGRTYRFERRPPDGMARAQTLVERHQLDYASVVQRLAP